MSYDPSALTPHDTTSIAWALAWTRFTLRDTASEPQYRDEELLAALEARAFTHDSVAYYRPHIAAAALIVSDPDRATTETLLGSMFTTRKPNAIAKAIRAEGAWVDDLIETAAEARPPTGRTLRPVF